MYKQCLDQNNNLDNTRIKKIIDNSFIPFDEKNSDYQTYLKWIDGYEWQQSTPFDGQWVKTSDGNTPLPADE